MKIKRTLLFIAGIVLTIFFAITFPMALIFPLWIFVALYRAPLKSMFAGREGKFLLAGMVFGLLIEVFAILDNIGEPVSVREVTLFHPQALPDMMVAFFYYLSLIGVWYLFLRKVALPPVAVMIIGGLFGVIVEQQGAMLRAIAEHGLVGVLMATFVFFVHGLYPMLAYQLTYENFSPDRTPPRWWHWPLAFAVLWLGALLFMLPGGALYFLFDLLVI
jgi:hypothetical protein